MSSNGLPPAIRTKMAAWRQRVINDVLDTDAWTAMTAELAMLQATPQLLIERRNLYEEMLGHYPTAAMHWKGYAELEMSAGNQSAVKAIFSRCLLNCPSVDLWRSYLTFIKTVNEPKGPAGVVEVRKAFEYSVDRIGQAAGAGPLWQDYLNLLQQPRPGSATYNALFGGGVAGQEDANRTAVLRRAYQRAIAIPTEAIDGLWRTYEGFEYAGPNKTLSRRLLEEQRPKYQQARAALGERARHLAALDMGALALPPTVGGARQAQQLAAWNAYLAWERSNYQRLEHAAYTSRVSTAYDQAMVQLLNYPDLWCEFALWHQEGGGGGAAPALAVLGRARQALPSTLIVHFAAADLEEAARNVEGAKKVYEDLLAPLEAAAPEDGSPAPVPLLTPEQSTLAWIQYQRFSRRAESLQSSRKVFMRARKAPGSQWHVFAASALMEWHAAKNETVPINIFELGLKNGLLQEPQYVIAYADFLLGIGNTDNARVLFERALPEIPAEKGGPLWDHFLRFEADHGTLAAQLTVQQRRREALGEISADGARIPSLKYRTLGLWPTGTDAQRSHYEQLLGERATVAVIVAAVPEAVVQSDYQGGAQMSPEEGDVSNDQGYEGGPSVEVPPEPVGSDITHFPMELGLFISSLPAPSGILGPTPDVDGVIEVLMGVDLTSSGVSAGERLVAAGSVYPRIGAPPTQQQQQQQQAPPPQHSVAQPQPPPLSQQYPPPQQQGPPPQHQQYSGQSVANGGSVAEGYPPQQWEGGDGLKRKEPPPPYGAPPSGPQYSGGMPEHDVFRQRQKQRAGPS